MLVHVEVFITGFLGREWALHSEIVLPKMGRDCTENLIRKTYIFLRSLGITVLFNFCFGLNFFKNSQTSRTQSHNVLSISTV